CKRDERLERQLDETRVEHLKQVDDLNKRMEKAEEILEKVATKFKQFVKISQESKVINKETMLGAKEQKLALKKLEGEIKELKYAIKVTEKSPTGFISKKYDKNDFETPASVIKE